MDDSTIIQMYWDRNDEAIRVTSEKYGRYCRTIAKNILSRDEDAEECVKDIPAEKRTLFVRRYWYADSISQIAKVCGYITQEER